MQRLQHDSNTIRSGIWYFIERIASCERRSVSFTFLTLLSISIGLARARISTTEWWGRVWEVIHLTSLSDSEYYRRLLKIQVGIILKCAWCAILRKTCHRRNDEFANWSSCRPIFGRRKIDIPLLSSIRDTSNYALRLFSRLRSHHRCLVFGINVSHERVEFLVNGGLTHFPG